MKTFLLGFFILILLSCTDNVKTQDSKNSLVNQNDNRTKAERKLDEQTKVINNKVFPNGLEISWFSHGKGKRVEDGEVYELNYKLRLENGKVLDGNHRLRRKMLPYLVGYQMQFKGWDLAMLELNEGDIADIKIPANLAYGQKGINGVIPSNSNIFLRLEVVRKMKADVIEGVKVWTLQNPAKDQKVVKVTEDSNLSFHYFVGTKSNPRYDNSYGKDAPFSIGMKDRSLLPGLKIALKNRKMFQKLWILVPADKAYKGQGLVNLVKPNESIFYDILLVDVDGKGLETAIN